MGVVLVTRAIVTGLTATLVLRYAVGLPLSALVRALAVGHPFARLVMSSWIPSSMAVLVWMVSGWLVARLHRAHPTGAVLSYAIFVNVAALPRGYVLVANVLEDMRFLPALMSYGIALVTATIGVLAGGWLANLGRPRIAERVTPGL
jgi:hypothetical protein